MASLDKMEGGAIEALGLIAVVVIAVLIFSAANSSISPSLYPVTVWGNFASWIDGLFYNGPQSLKPIADPIQKPIDNWLSSVYGWLTTNTPNPSNSQGWTDYASQFQGPDATVASGTNGAA